MMQNINLNNYTVTGYWYFPWDLVRLGYKYSILNGPESPFTPPGGFGLDVRYYGTAYCTQTLYVHSTNGEPITWQRARYYTNNAPVWGPWKKVAYST